MNIKDQLEQKRLILDPLKDQFFLEDEEIIEKMISFADLGKKDTVLEIGAGIGNLTRKIAAKAGKVIAFEIDPRFKPFLRNLPKNVEVRWENAWKYVQLRGKYKHKKEYNKVIANPPYSFIEPFLHNLTFLDYDKVILLVPLRFLKKTAKWGIFGSFFKADVKMYVDRHSFYPAPKTNSAVIELLKLPDPLKTKDSGLFLRQYVYQHEGQLVKNSLMEGIIKYADLVHSKKLTKNEARKIITESGIGKGLLEKNPDSFQIYEEISQKLGNLFTTH